MGIMRVARDLGKADDLLAAADAVLASSTLGSEDKTEAQFSRGMAQQLKGNTSAAITTWTPLASLSDDLYGAKSAVYLSQALLDKGNTSEAAKVAEKFINSGTPHTYWLGRGFIVLSDIYRKQGKKYEADQYLKALRENYPGTEADIFSMIDERLNK
jgi:tetratricopeptide (TPR) repeat protein